MSQVLKSLEKDLKNLANSEKAKILSRFFKTWTWQYGEWDIFLGIVVPEQRKVAKNYAEQLDFSDIDTLLESRIHEHRLVGLLILVSQFEKWNTTLKKTIFDFYLSKTHRINNWDLVDLSVYKIVGEYLLNSVSHSELVSKSPEQLSILITLAHSSNLWEKRIAIIATFAFIKRWTHEPTFKIAEILLHDKHDLIHKAVWWMLREVGKRIGEEIEEEFLQKYATQMPRTMLRYAIEKFEEEKRQKYLKNSDT